MSNIVQQQTNSFALAPTTLQEAMKFAETLAKSTMVPKHYQNKSGDILVAMQMGAELGLKPIQSLQNIAVINGKPSVYGDSLLALVQTNPLCEYINESFDEKTMTAKCCVKRKGEEEYIATFSQEDAKQASLWGKGGPWTQYPKRMLQMRARGFALRDKFADVLGGLITAEEAKDMPVDNKPSMKTITETESKEEPATPLSKLDYFLDQVEADEKQETLKLATGKVEELQELIAVSNIPDTTISKWCNAGGVASLEELPEEKVIACIEYVRNKGVQASVEV